jgi:putative spermidine/putrescine transport system permease protein
MARRDAVLDWVVVTIVALVQILPVIAVALNAVATDWAGSILPTGYTWRWVEQLLQDPRFTVAIWHSLVVSFGALVIATCVSVPAVLAAHCYLPRLDRWLAALVIIPYAVPGIVLAVGLLRLYAGNYGVVLTGTPWILLLGYVPLGVAFFYVPMKNNLRALPVSEFLEAGRILGASDFAVLRRVVLPCVMPGFIVGVVMNFSLAVSEFVYANLLVGGSYPTLQILMNVLSSGSGHLLSVLITAYFLIVAIATSVLLTVSSRQDRAA